MQRGCPRRLLTDAAEAELLQRQEARAPLPEAWRSIRRKDPLPELPPKEKREKQQRREAEVRRPQELPVRRKLHPRNPLLRRHEAPKDPRRKGPQRVESGGEGLRSGPRRRSHPAPHECVLAGRQVRRGGGPPPRPERNHTNSRGWGGGQGRARRMCSAG